jgi:hypothetical protein
VTGCRDPSILGGRVGVVASSRIDVSVDLGPGAPEQDRS